ncbi:MAG: iron-siderophore ABC transporter substrate-binding protein [Anaerolineales bacterium]|nr:iron-siderophore ABC transporter substrate-binding protein [Anaerolineales bacterium]MCW5855665.1 iron-siderophore ABC transporter substrate-binding protein [Anaerolineales bacterium]
MRKTQFAWLAVVLLVTAACGAPSPANQEVAAPEAAVEAPAEDVVAEETGPAALVEDGAYPVTIAHKYGETTITELPDRIVLVGLTEQDALLALGVVPVATREWYGEKPGAIFPWAESYLGDAQTPLVLSSAELNFEQIAGLNPDLIVGLYSGITQDEYDTLSQIAPVVAQPAAYADWGIPWQEITLVIGQIVGQPQRAANLVAEVEGKFAAAQQQYPQFVGASGVVNSPWGYPDNYYIYGPQDVRGRIMTNLGFVIPAEIGELVGDAFGASVSRERLDLVDLDVIIWLFNTAEEGAAYRAEPVYQQLNVYAEGRDILLTADQPLYDAMNFGTVLSLDYVVSELPPLLVAALDGNPATQ